MRESIPHATQSEQDGYVDHQRGFDNVAVWRTIWQQHEQGVCWIYHTERAVAFQEQVVA
jgi:hypothetical protein